MQTPRRNIAHRAGRWSATHRKTAVIGWILFVVLATVVGGMVGQRNLDESAQGNGESKRGDMIIDRADFRDQSGEQVLIQGKGSMKADDPAITAAVRDVVTRLQGTPHVTDIESPLSAKDRANTVSQDGRSVVVNFELQGDPTRARSASTPPLAAVAAAQKAHPELRVEEFGDAQREKALVEARQGRLQAGRDALAAADADHPAASRSARSSRRGVPVLLGVTAVVAHDGPARRRQPAHRRSTTRSPSRDPADRPGRRRRLRDVLSAPRARGARQRAAPPRGARDRRRDLRPRRARSPGFTVMIAMAGMFFAGTRRSRRSASARSWSSPSRCSARSPCCPRCCRFARRSAGSRRAASRSVAKRRHAARRVARLERDPRPRPAPPAGRGRCSPAACSIALAAAGARHAHRAARASTGYSRRPADHADLRPDPGRVPGRRRPGRSSSSRPTTSPRPQVQAAHQADCTTRRSPPASCRADRPSTSSPDKTVAIVSLAGRRATAPTTASERALDGAARRRRPGDARQGRRRRGARDRHDRRRRRTSTT